MTVAQLLAELKTANPDSQVFVEAGLLILDVHKATKVLTFDREQERQEESVVLVTTNPAADG
jgi:hypothetical protein